MPTELEELKEFTSRVPRLAFKTVFDVGANIGQSVRLFRSLWPGADIYAFEPVQSSFQRLQSAVAAHANVKCYQIALGDQPMRASMQSQSLGKANRILSGANDTSGPVEEVEVETGARFCASHGIHSIDYLKIDAEGFDLKACQGFEPMLKEQQIGAIQIEVGMQLTDPVHLPLHAFLSYLHPLGYRLYKIHNQHVQSHRPVSRRGNAVFVSLRQIKVNTITEAAPEQISES